MLERLAGVYERLPTAATAEQWSVALQDFACELGLHSVACNGNDTAVPLDAEAWDLLRRRLQASAELEVRLTGSAASLDLRGVLDRIQHICRVEELPKDHDEIGRVRVLSASQARGIRVPYLFVAGLSEKSFPASLRDDRIYSAAEHRELNRAGLRFVERHEPLRRNAAFL